MTKTLEDPQVRTSSGGMRKGITHASALRACATSTTSAQQILRYSNAPEAGRNHTNPSKMQQRSSLPLEPHPHPFNCTSLGSSLRLHLNFRPGRKLAQVVRHNMKPKYGGSTGARRQEEHCNDPRRLSSLQEKCCK